VTHSYDVTHSYIVWMCCGSYADACVINISVCCNMTHSHDVTHSYDVTYSYHVWMCCGSYADACVIHLSYGIYKCFMSRLRMSRHRKVSIRSHRSTYTETIIYVILSAQQAERREKYAYHSRTAHIPKHHSLHSKTSTLKRRTEASMYSPHGTCT